MILADKIIRLRKKNGWSQEELAEKMNVSRQAVSKWESAQSIPDLQKILQMANLFGVTTDYLLKDEIEDEEFTDTPDAAGVKKVSMADANTFLNQRETAAKRIALATFLCILGAAVLITMGAVAQAIPAIPENLFAGIGMIVLFLLVAVAVGIYITCGLKNAPFEFLEKEPFETEYGVVGMVRERQKKYRDTYVRSNVIGTVLCILSVVPLMAAAFSGSDLFVLFTVPLLLIIVGIGVVFFIHAGVRWASMQKLLKEGDYAPKGKVGEAVSSIYWILITAVYLGWSFLTNDWHITWIIWPVAGVLYGAVAIICKLIDDKEKKGE